MFKNLFLVLTLLFSQVSLVLALELPIRFDRLSFDDGLPQSSATDVLHDRQGFLWVGTQDGLARYDGYSFKVFKHNADGLHSLSANFITVLFEDSKGWIWVGTFGGGLNRFNPKTEQFSQYRFDASNPKSLSNDIILTITEDHQGSLWVGTKQGLNRLNPNTDQFSRYRFDANNSNSLSHDVVNAIVVDHEGMLWIGTTAGLNYFNPTTDNFRHYRIDASTSNSLFNDNVRAIVEDHQGMIWVGTADGLNRFNPETEEFSHYNFDSGNANSLSHDDIKVMMEDDQGILWVGTHAGGLNRFNPETEQFSHYRFESGNLNSLSHDNVWSITQDNGGTFWVGTFNGLNRFNPKAERFNHYRSDASDSNSLSNETVWALSEDNQGILWVGTTGGLNRYNSTTKQFNHYQVDASTPNSLSHNLVKAITQDHQGTLWLGTYRGLNRFNPEIEKFKHYRSDKSNSNSLSHDFVKTIIEDRQNILWLGTPGGLNRFNPETEQFAHYRFDASNPNSLSNNSIMVIKEDRQGLLWLGTDGGGLNKFDPKTEAFSRYRFNASTINSLSDDVVFAITEAHDGVLWIGTSNGLNRMDRESGTFERFTEENGLPNNVIYSIEEDHDGLLWLSTNQGISRFDPKIEHFTNYDVGDGLQSNEFNYQSSFKSKRGELFFGGINGFNRFFPNEITQDNKKPIVVFTDMRLFNKAVPIYQEQDKQANKTTPSKHSFSLKKAIHSTSEITLTHLENLVSFEFSALHFSNSKKNQYAYKLEGFDTDWITTDYKNRRATYTNLPSGQYVLRVKASNSDGVWNGEGASLNITVLSPPWLTWWAYCIYAMILTSLIVVFIKIQLNKVLFERKLSAELERKVVERTNELQQAYSQLEELSLTDQLTGLKNRRYLINNIENDISLVLRKNKNENNIEGIGNLEDSDLIFFIVDLDDFKQVNDNHGHTAGDSVLIQITVILEKVFRETDHLVRWGGEEFLIIARFTDRNNAAELAERLRAMVENYSFDIGGGKAIKKTCSIGFSSYPFLQQNPTALDWERVIDVADHCLYAAKKSNRNAWVGLEGTALCKSDDLFSRVKNQTDILIKAEELIMLTSLSEDKNVTW